MTTKQGQEASDSKIDALLHKRAKGDHLSETELSILSTFDSKYAGRRIRTHTVTAAGELPFFVKDCFLYLLPSSSSLPPSLPPSLSPCFPAFSRLLLF